MFLSNTNNLYTNLFINNIFCLNVKILISNVIDYFYMKHLYFNY